MKKQHLLVYYQNPYPSIFIESLVAELVRKGYKVFFLTKSVKGIIHERIEAHGAEVYGYNPQAPQFFRFILHWWYLIRFCWKHKIDIIYSHLQLANLVALFGSFFFRARVYPCRHHVDEVVIVQNKTALRIDKMVNRLAKKIIVVANAAKKFMIENENVRADKIEVIPLGYDFSLYAKPDAASVRKIREAMDCHFLLMVIARMTPNKRHIIVMQVVDKLIREGLDVKLLVMDRGQEKENLEKFVREKNIMDRVLFTGFLNNTMDYVAAADLLLNPSIIEASNQVVKEAALVGKTCVTCSGIGDFDEYIIHRENGFLVSKDNTVEEMCSIVREYYNKKDELQQMGMKLREEVLTRFDIRKVGEKYLRVAGLPIEN